MFQVSNEMKTWSAGACWRDFFLLVTGLVIMTVLLAFYSFYLLHLGGITTAAKEAVGSNKTDESSGIESKTLASQSNLQDGKSVRKHTENDDRRQQVTPSITDVTVIIPPWTRIRIFKVDKSYSVDLLLSVADERTYWANNRNQKLDGRSEFVYL